MSSSFSGRASSSRIRSIDELSELEWNSANEAKASPSRLEEGSRGAPPSALVTFWVGGKGGGGGKGRGGREGKGGGREGKGGGGGIQQLNRAINYTLIVQSLF